MYIFSHFIRRKVSIIISSRFCSFCSYSQDILINWSDGRRLSQFFVVAFFAFLKILPTLSRRFAMFIKFCKPYFSHLWFVESSWASREELRVRNDVRFDCLHNNGKKKRVVTDVDYAKGMLQSYIQLGETRVTHWTQAILSSISARHNAFFNQANQREISWHTELDWHY